MVTVVLKHFYYLVSPVVFMVWTSQVNSTYKSVGCINNGPYTDLQKFRKENSYTNLVKKIWIDYYVMIIPPTFYFHMCKILVNLCWKDFGCLFLYFSDFIVNKYIILHLHFSVLTRIYNNAHTPSSDWNNYEAIWNIFLAGFNILVL